MPKYFLKKTERLKSRKAIDKLFSQGRSFTQYPFRIVWAPMPKSTSAPIQIAFSVPRRRFPKAIQRNTLRRRMCEAYRLYKPQLYQQLPQPENQYAIMLIYTAPTPLPYQSIATAMPKLIHRFIKKISPHTN